MDMKRGKRVDGEWERLGYLQSAHARYEWPGKDEIYALLAADGPLNDPCIQNFKVWGSSVFRDADFCEEALNSPAKGGSV